ncbi:MAG: hypothetical protein ACRD4S_14590 [Candidatus Acidiferrales bacterium]
MGWWHTLWHSAEWLSEVTYRLQVIAVICAVCAGGFTLVALIAGRRSRTLEAATTENQQRKWEAERKRLETEAATAALSAESATKLAVHAKTNLTVTQQELNELRQNQEPREISRQQHSLLVSKLSPFLNQDIQIMPLTGDQEIQSFAEQIQDILLDANWNPQTIVTMEPQANYPPGLLLQVTNLKDHPAAADALRTALQEVGYTVAMGTASDVPPKSMRLIVGSKS